MKILAIVSRKGGAGKTTLATHLAMAASIRIARSAGKPFFVVVNAAPVQGSEVTEMQTALEAAGVAIAPVVLHQRKAFSARMQEGRTAQEMEPNGKAAAEIHALLL